MNMNLTRTDFLESGIFGLLEAEDQSLELVTLEHAYAVIPDSMSSSATYAPKLPIGSYTCVRGQHTLEHHLTPFDAFEVMGVPGHTNILIHIGNYNADSAGCVLVGLNRKDDMITLSKQAFDLFMELQEGIDSFQLTVS